jgi:hypothetical protein
MTKITVEVDCGKDLIHPSTQAFKLVVSILKYMKLKNVRRVQMKLSRLYQIKPVLNVKQVQVFINFVQYHTKSGKLRKRSYITILRKGREALEALIPVVKKENVKKLSVKRSLEKLSKIQEVPLTPKPAIDSDTKKRKRLEKTDEDAEFLKLVRKSDSNSLSSDEHGIITRSIVFFNTMIPPQTLRSIQVEYGVQRVAHYTVAAFAVLVGVPNQRDGQLLSSDEKRQTAVQVVKLRNKIRAKQGNKQSIGLFDKPVQTADHTFWLTLPTNVLNDANVRIGRWDFSERPKCKVGTLSKFADA